jgi:hypothetical protein
MAGNAKIHSTTSLLKDLEKCGVKKLATSFTDTIKYNIGELEPALVECDKKLESARREVLFIESRLMVARSRVLRRVKAREVVAGEKEGLETMLVKMEGLPAAYEGFCRQQFPTNIVLGRAPPKTKKTPKR